MSSRTELANDVSRWMARSDVGQDPLFTGLLRVAESRIRRAVRARDQDSEITFEVTSGTALLPPSLLRIRSINIEGDPNRTLEYYTPESMRASRSLSKSQGGTHQAYTIEGNRLTLIPAATLNSPLNTTHRLSLIHI